MNRDCVIKAITKIKMKALMKIKYIERLIYKFTRWFL